MMKNNKSAVFNHLILEPENFFALYKNSLKFAFPCTLPTHTFTRE